MFREFFKQSDLLFELLSSEVLKNVEQEKNCSSFDREKKICRDDYERSESIYNLWPLSKEIQIWASGDNVFSMDVVWCRIMLIGEGRGAYRALFITSNWRKQRCSSCSRPRNCWNSGSLMNKSNHPLKIERNNSKLQAFSSNCLATFLS